MNILIVEDEYIIGLDLKLFLVSKGHNVIGITGFGEEAVRLALKEKPDMVLMDINLDGNLNGIEAADIIHKHIPCKILFITGQSDMSSIKQVEETGYQLLFKPYDKHKLESFIAQ